MSNKRILITQNQFTDLAGSEIIVIELAEHFLNQGFAVDIYTHIHGDPISSLVPNKVNIFTEDPGFLLNQYDLVWIHHQLIPPSLLSQLGSEMPKNTKIVFHHMSPYEPLEFPFLTTIELSINDSILCNSLETKNKFVASGIPENMLTVFGNPAPDSFYTTRPIVHHLQSILVVSNHIPSEIRQAGKLLSDRGFQVEFIGQEVKTKRITPQRLRKFDLIVTIGKTVQYSLAAGIPVYCYDRFGGPGFIDNDNRFKLAADYNFSGRGFKTMKTAEEIVEDIINHYSSAATYWHNAHKKYAKNYILSEQLKTVLSRTSRKKLHVENKDMSAASAIFDIIHREIQNRVILNDYRKLAEDNNSRYTKARKENTELWAAIAERDEVINLKNTHITNLEKMVSRFPIHQIIQVGKLFRRILK